MRVKGSLGDSVGFGMLEGHSRILALECMVGGEPSRSGNLCGVGGSCRAGGFPGRSQDLEATKGNLLSAPPESSSRNGAVPIPHLSLTLGHEC